MLCDSCPTCIFGPWGLRWRKWIETGLMAHGTPHVASPTDQNLPLARHLSLKDHKGGLAPFRVVLDHFFSRIGAQYISDLCGAASFSVDLTVRTDLWPALSTRRDLLDGTRLTWGPMICPRRKLCGPGRMCYDDGWGGGGGMDGGHGWGSVCGLSGVWVEECSAGRGQHG